MTSPVASLLEETGGGRDEGELIDVVSTPSVSPVPVTLVVAVPSSALPVPAVPALRPDLPPPQTSQPVISQPLLSQPQPSLPPLMLSPSLRAELVAQVRGEMASELSSL